MFKKYRSIENHYKGDFIRRILERGLGKEDVLWYRFEKADGGNFSFICDGFEVKCGKRNHPLVKENFFQWEKLRDLYKEDILKLFVTLQKIYPKMEQFNLYGEIHGGMYPGHPVKTKPLNRNTYYCPDIRFIAFDLHVAMKESGGTYQLLYDEYSPILKKHNVPFLEPMSKTTLSEALKFSPEFNTTLPKLYGLEEHEGNIAEGAVLKPVSDVYIIGKDGQPTRPIIKHKHKRSMEKQKSFNLEGVKKMYSDDVIAVKDYITEPRLINVVTKIGGDVTLSDMTKVIRAFREDILEEYYGVYPEEPDNKVRTKAINKILGSNAAPMVKQFLINYEKENKKLEQEIAQNTQNVDHE